MKNLDEIREVLAGLVKIYDRQNAMDIAYQAFGYYDNPAFDTAGEIKDLIYKFIGEHTDTLSDSTTHKALDILVDDELRIETLMVAYLRNHISGDRSAQPAPAFYSPEELAKSVMQNGGYVVGG